MSALLTVFTKKDDALKISKCFSQKFSEKCENNDFLYSFSYFCYPFLSKHFINEESILMIFISFFISILYHF